MKTKLLILALCIPLSVHAQDEQTLDETLKELAVDLTNLQSELEENNRKETAVSWSWDQFPSQVIVTTEKGLLKSGADTNAATVLQSKRGEAYMVVDKVNDWYAVELPKSVNNIDTAWVNASQVSPKLNALVTTERKSFSDQVYEKTLESVQKLKSKYDKNPNVSVSGFSINVGVPPSVTVSFDFKK